MCLRRTGLSCGLALLLIVAVSNNASAFIAITGYATGSTSSADSSLTLPVPSSAAAGQVLVAQVAARGGSRNQFIAPSGWILARRADADGAGEVLIGQAIYYHVANATEPASYTWNFSSAGPNSAAGAIVSYSGVEPNQPIDAGRTIGDPNLTDTTITAPFLLVPHDHTTDHVLCFYAVADSSFITTPGPHRRYSFRASSGGISVAMSEQVLTSGGNTTDYPATATSARPNIGAQIALLPVLGSSHSYGAPGDSVWPLFHNDLQHTGLSPIDTSANTGTKMWQFPGTGETALGADGTIYIGSGDHNLYAVRPDGTLQWRIQEAPSTPVHTPVVLEGGPERTIYFGSDALLFNEADMSVFLPAKLYAVAPDAGEENWAFATGSMGMGSIIYPATPTPDGTIYFGAEDFYIYALNSDGTLKWKFRTGNEVHCSPAIGWDGTIYEGTDNLYAFTPSGTLKWKYPLVVNGSSTAVAADGTIYAGSGNASSSDMNAINPDGSLKWTFPVAGSSQLSAPAVGADGTIYFGSGDGKVYAVDPNGKSKWQFVTGGPVVSSPALGADGTIYDASEDSNLYAFNPDGSLKWKFALGNGTDDSPVIGADGSVYIGSNDNLYAIH